MVVSLALFLDIVAFNLKYQRCPFNRLTANSVTEKSCSLTFQGILANSTRLSYIFDEHCVNRSHCAYHAGDFEQYGLYHISKHLGDLREPQLAFRKYPAAEQLHKTMRKEFYLQTELHIPPSGCSASLLLRGGMVEQTAGPT